MLGLIERCLIAAPRGENHVEDGDGMFEFRLQGVGKVHALSVC